MTKQELKSLAQKIADAEKTIYNSENEKEKSKAKETILELSNSIVNLEDLLQLDEYIQEILS